MFLKFNGLTTLTIIVGLAFSTSPLRAQNIYPFSSQPLPPVSTQLKGVYGYQEVLAAGVTLDALQIQKVPELPSYAVLYEHFVKIRDERFVDWRGALPIEKRRLPWLYVLDGCGFRAEHARVLVPPQFGKVFANLSQLSRQKLREVCSPFGLDCTRNWNYHVALVSRVAEQLYVLDPAIEAVRPLTLEEWLGRMVDSTAVTQVRVSLCEAWTLFPGDACWGQRPAYLQRRLDDVMKAGYLHRYLNEEVSMLIRYAKDPAQWLGDSPPWRQ
jgi:hypothetical protein